MDARQYLRMPPPLLRRRLMVDALVAWLGTRVAFTLFSRAPDPLLPASETSLAIVCIAVLLCWVQVRRLREVAFLRNLGVSWSGQILLSVCVAGALELVARVTALGLLPPAPGP